MSQEREAMAWASRSCRGAAALISDDMTLEITLQVDIVDKRKRGIRIMDHTHRALEPLVLALLPVEADAYGYIGNFKCCPFG